MRNNCSSKMKVDWRVELRGLATEKYIKSRTRIAAIDYPGCLKYTSKDEGSTRSQAHSDWKDTIDRRLQCKHQGHFQKGEGLQRKWDKPGALMVCECSLSCSLHLLFLDFSGMHTTFWAPLLINCHFYSLVPDTGWNVTPTSPALHERTLQDNNCTRDDERTSPLEQLAPSEPSLRDFAPWYTYHLTIAVKATLVMWQRQQIHSSCSA